MKVAVCLAGGTLLLAGAAWAAVEGMTARTAGDVTVFADGRNAFSFPAANLPDEERTRFAIGNSFFKRNWVQAPASTTARDGLGPHFIARSCGGCHIQDGRGKPPEILDRLSTEQPVDLLFRLSIPGNDSKHGVVPDPVYGDQFNNAAIAGVKPEGKVHIQITELRGKYPDGTPYVLKKPSYSFSDLGYGPMHPQVMVSPRIAPQVIGLGLLEAIEEKDVLNNAKRQAAQPGPIKGVPNRVWDAYAQKNMLGRFGWKANVATLAHQIRTPLSAAMLYAQNLANPRATWQVQQQFQQKLLSRLQDLELQVSDMLLFARSGSSQQVAEFTLDNLITEVETAVDALLVQHDADFTLLCDEPSLRLIGNQHALCGAIQNLIQNSLQAIPAKAKIVLELKASAQHSGKLLLRLTDNGPGVAPALHDNLFEPFVTGRAQGTGLGLAVVQAVAHSHHGSVRYVPTGQGACFEMLLPLSHSAQEASE